MDSREPNLTQDEMPRNQERKMNAIKQQVDLGSYSVDAQAVADAIVRRMLAAASRRPQAQGLHEHPSE